MFTEQHHCSAKGTSPDTLFLVQSPPYSAANLVLHHTSGKQRKRQRLTIYLPDIPPVLHLSTRIWAETTCISYSVCNSITMWPMAPFPATFSHQIVDHKAPPSQSSLRTIPISLSLHSPETLHRNRKSVVSP